MCVHGAVTQSAIMISAIYYPVLTRLISSNGITNPQRWLGYVILHPSERQKSRAESGLGCFLSFVMFILILFSGFYMLLGGRGDKDGGPPLVSL